MSDKPVTTDLETIARRVATELRDCCADPNALNTDAAEVLVMEALVSAWNGALDESVSVILPQIPKPWASDRIINLKHNE